jgi:hypothetical protein
MNDHDPRELNDDAKKAISEAVRIVAEDRAEKFYREMRSHMEKFGKTEPPVSDPATPPTTEPPVDPPVDPNKPTPPPLKPPTPPAPEKKKRGLYWGESDDN